MLTAFARFGERAATIVRMPGIEGGQTGLERGSRQRRPAFDAATAIQQCVCCKRRRRPAATLYLPAAILLINSSTRQLSCSFS
jgi:hypothetical protein